ncbi:hypothetical protein K8R47_01490 [archaeon]|nr:hypothetical protein [archaeon]
MKKIENPENLREYLGKYILAARDGYVGNSHKLTPCWAGIGIIEQGHNDSLWIKGVSLGRSTDNCKTNIHILGVYYNMLGPMGEIPVPLPNTFYYTFDSEDEGGEVVRKIRDLEMVVIEKNI